MARCALSIVPVPGASTAWEQTRSALHKTVGEYNQAIKQLVGRIFRCLMVCGCGVDNTALVGNFANEMLRLL